MAQVNYFFSRTTIVVRVVIAAVTVACTAGVYAEPLTNDEYQTTTTNVFQYWANATQEKIRYADWPQLVAAMLSENTKGTPEAVVALGYSHFSVIKANVNANEIQAVTEALLQQHAESFVRVLLDYANQNGERYSVARITLELAQYYARQGRWNDVVAQLKSLNVANELSKINSDTAIILMGAALQHLKQHRESLKYYSRITPDSSVYTIAQLNIAIVYLRQDWWTDAQIAIDQAIAQTIESPPVGDAEIVNRLYTTLGFSQLQQGFYRKARDSFRHVKLKSQYTDRALIGIGMAALNQEDFVGAYNAFKQLKAANNKNAPTEQAYLLEAYALVKLKENAAAAESYAEANGFYQQKFTYYENLLESINNPDSSLQAETLAKIHAEFLENNSQAAANLMRKLTLLKSMQGYSLPPALGNSVSQLYSRVSQAYLAAAHEDLSQQQRIIKSYLSQSTFGLTRLLDN